MTSDDMSQSGGGLPSPPTRSLRRSSCVTINLIITTRVLTEHLEKGGCSGFLVKCVNGTYTGYISLHYMAMCIKSIKSTHGVSTYIPHLGIRIELNEHAVAVILLLT